MLDVLRKNASSWFSKALLGLIALIFALYFGFSGGGPPQGGTAPIAKVNGQNIPSGHFNQMVSNQLEIYQRLGTQKTGPEFQQVLQAQALQRLVSQTLLAQAAHRFGLHISDVELATTIRSNPSFQREGRFDEQFYLNQFKPFYERQNGQNYEFALREDLLQERLREVLKQADVVSQASAQEEIRLRETELRFLKLQIPFGPGEGARSKDEALKVADEWIQARQSQLSGKETLKIHQLETSEVGPKPLNALSAFFGGAEGLPLLSCLAHLEPGQVCPKAYPLSDQMVAVALLERNQKEPDAQAVQDMENQLKTAKQNLILTGVVNYLTQQAKIETYLNP